MKKIFLFILITAASSLWAGTPVKVDNEKIQQYRGHTGRWVINSSPGILARYVRTFGSSYSLIIKLNGYNFRRERAVFIPYSEKYLDRLKSRGLARDKVENEDDYIWPVHNFERISSAFGRRWRGFHEGIDIPAGRGVPILAARSGIVTAAKFIEGYGKTVRIEHRKNMETRYCHASEILVKEGDLVKKGQVIAFVGSTGNSTGAHLHFEVRCRNIPLNPLDFLPYSSHVKKAQYMKEVE